MSTVISRAELSRWAGVSRTAVTKACRIGGPLFDALSGKGVDVEHPIAREWLGAHGVHELPGSRPKAPPAKKKAARTARPKTAKPKSAPAPAVHPTVPGQEISDLEELTVREVVMRYGSVDGFKRFVESLKNIAEYKHRELRVRQQRGELIERDVVAGVVFPMIDVAFARLVSDVPESLSKILIARVEAGGPETAVDVVQLIRDANSRVLKNVKQSAARLEFLTDGN